LLSKVDIFDIRNNKDIKPTTNNFVVNCSQKLISLIFGTTYWRRGPKDNMLWIALKSWYLWYSEQLSTYIHLTHFSCELLSKVDIFDIRNNNMAYTTHALSVVNCSQKLISLIFGTTRPAIEAAESVLWIALKSWYLWYSEQLENRVKRERWVVNCSQKLISLIFGTTYIELYQGELCCELLSKVDIFDIRNNAGGSDKAAACVVNCSQKLISLIFGTTCCLSVDHLPSLWIALKSWYLWYSEQRKFEVNMEVNSCELLSKVDIFDIRNNVELFVSCVIYVVNCSQKLISLIFGTT